MSQKRRVAIGFPPFVLSGIPPAVLSSQIIPNKDGLAIMPMRDRVKLIKKGWNQRSDADVEKYNDPPEYFLKGRTRNGVNAVIHRGDVISCDTDLFLLGLVIDSHRHAYAFEPHTRVAVPEWEHGLELGIDQVTVFTENGLKYMARPQERQWHIIR